MKIFAKSKKPKRQQNAKKQDVDKLTDETTCQLADLKVANENTEVKSIGNKEEKLCEGLDLLEIESGAKISKDSDKNETEPNESGQTSFAEKPDDKNKEKEDWIIANKISGIGHTLKLLAESAETGDYITAGSPNRSKNENDQTASTQAANSEAKSGGI